MSYRRLVVLVLLLYVFAASPLTSLVSAGDEWLPISPEELKMTSEPKAPGAPAIILYRQVDRDDSDVRRADDYTYIREKIFTEEGRMARSSTLTAKSMKRKSSRLAVLNTLPRPSRSLTFSQAASLNTTT